MKRTLRLGRVAKRSIKAFSEDDMTTHAAALAYQTFFSLFPFALFLVALLGLLRLPDFSTRCSFRRGSSCQGRPRRPWSR